MYQNLVGFTRIGWVVEGVFKKLVIVQLVLLKKFGNKVDKIEILGYYVGHKSNKSSRIW